VDKLERQYLVKTGTAEEFRQYVKYVADGWYRSNYEQRAMLEAIWVPLLMQEWERREKGRAERAQKAQARQLRASSGCGPRRRRTKSLRPAIALSPRSATPTRALAMRR
jgi:hypothetical protein